MTQDNKKIVREALVELLDGDFKSYDINGACENFKYSAKTVRAIKNGSSALTALDKLIDPAAMIETLEGMKREDSPAPSVVALRFNHPSTPDNETYYLNATHNAALDAAIKEITWNI